MGIKNLLPQLASITQSKHVSDYKGKTCAVDTYAWLHRGFYSCGIELGQGIQTEKWLEFCLKRVEMLLNNNIKVVMVFDGHKLPSKKGTEGERDKKRRDAKQQALEYLRNGDRYKANEKFASSVDLTPQMAFQLRNKLQNYQNVECIIAPYEADAQLCYLNVTGYVDFIISEDSDLLAFGSLCVFYKMDNDGSGKEIKFQNLSKCQVMNFQKWTQNQFLTFCIFCGCDYLDSIKNVGAKKAYSLVNQHKSYKRIINELRREGKYSVPEDYEKKFVQAFLTFRFQVVFDPINKKLVSLNDLILEQMKERYSKIDEIDPNENEETTKAWEDFEKQILERNIILQMIQEDFDLSFLMDMQQEKLMRIVNWEIDPDTMKEYEKDSSQNQNQNLNSGSLAQSKYYQNLRTIQQPTKQYFQGKQKTTSSVNQIKDGKKQTTLKFNFTQNFQKSRSNSVEKSENDQNVNNNYQKKQQFFKIQEKIQNLNQIKSENINNDSIKENQEMDKKSKSDDNLQNQFKNQINKNKINFNSTVFSSNNSNNNSLSKQSPSIFNLESFVYQKKETKNTFGGNMKNNNNKINNCNIFSKNNNQNQNNTIVNNSQQKSLNSSFVSNRSFSNFSEKASPSLQSQQTFLHEECQAELKNIKTSKRLQTQFKVPSASKNTPNQFNLQQNNENNGEKIEKVENKNNNNIYIKNENKNNNNNNYLRTDFLSQKLSKNQSQKNSNNESPQETQLIQKSEQELEEQIQKNTKNDKSFEEVDDFFSKQRIQQMDNKETKKPNKQQKLGKDGYFKQGSEQQNSEVTLEKNQEKFQYLLSQSDVMDKEGIQVQNLEENYNKFMFKTDDEQIETETVEISYQQKEIQKNIQKEQRQNMEEEEDLDNKKMTQSCYQKQDINIEYSEKKVRIYQEQQEYSSPNQIIKNEQNDKYKNKQHIQKFEVHLENNNNKIRKVLEERDLFNLKRIKNQKQIIIQKSENGLMDYSNFQTQQQMKDYLQQIFVQPFQQSPNII
ncbi:5'-3' exonuclease, C-terminal domain [Pseudocohnilembus persalinus]|uniref:Exonuclease 1 n=1 Tax=Pseudocohnilembus persalinus TaxID=266149 RepID=A0A0V0QEH0_PSEPJ|nr:5'-3' exonuclease, C-terminal domain [Pseudocohnilembus persalinus]|eukprot:KRX00552.1 5'-3' exonuclease, C-terminal domain [Pseudocohnilembus persalinus]